MQRILILALLALGLFASSADAQVRPKAYAPENLATLAPDDRARVISLEYEDQSGGRRIPDDQLEFYMDQVRSGWSFSRIKADIAESLTGRYADGGWQGGRPVPGPVTNIRVFRCESVNGRSRTCETGFRNRVELTRNLSRVQCIEGNNWGQMRGAVWVTRGCRAEFIEARRGWDDGDRYGYSVTCSSPSESYRTCAWNARYGRPELLQTLSDARCIEGRTWGFRGNQIWVDRGCRGRFGPRPYR